MSFNLHLYADGELIQLHACGRILQLSNLDLCV